MRVCRNHNSSYRYYCCLLSVAPILLKPERTTLVTRLYNESSFYLDCEATAKPALTSDNFKWTKKGSLDVLTWDTNLERKSISEPGNYYDLSFSWMSRLHVNTSTATCNDVIKYDGDYTCDVIEGSKGAESPVTTLETLCKYLYIPYITRFYSYTRYTNLCRLKVDLM